jgi:pimeloyl-ACP methyl ester carboxylesterase
MNNWWEATFPKGCQFLQITDSNGSSASIAYGEKGSGQPIIFVHGIGTWSYSWRHNIDFLAQHFRVICFDAKGYGFSEKSTSTERVEQQVVELAQIIQLICEEPIVVVSESLGALITLAAVQAYPELFAKVVLMNVPIFPKRLPNLGMQFLAHIPLSVVRVIDRLRLARLLAPLVQQVVQLARSEIIVENAQTSPEEAYWLTYPYTAFPGTITKFAKDLKQGIQEIHRLQNNQPNLITQIQDGLSSIACPTLILWGDQDRWFPVEDGQELHKHIPESIFQIISNCGHQAAGGRPDIVNPSILTFLEMKHQES